MPPTDKHTITRKNNDQFNDQREQSLIAHHSQLRLQQKTSKSPVEQPGDSPPDPPHVEAAPCSVWRGWERHNWREFRRRTKQPCITDKHLKVIDLCAGCGGLALATRQLGYEHAAVVDSDYRRIQTLRANGFHRAIHSELKDMDWTPYRGLAMLTAGLPCQPWSIGGTDRGEQDERNIWHEGVRAIRDIQPQAFLLEMVTGFLRPKFDSFRKQILAQLSQLGYVVGSIASQCHRGKATPTSREMFHHGSSIIRHYRTTTTTYPTDTT